MKTFGFIFGGFGGLFMCIGIAMTVVQHLKIENSVPVQAVVLSKDISSHRSSSSSGGSSTTYKPVVKYRYTFEGREYTSKSVTPLSTSQSRAWAQSIIDQFKVGSEVEAYVNPNKPGKAFLIKKPEFLPYIFILFPMIFVTIGLGIAMSGGASAKNPPTPVASTQGWFEVQPARPIKSRVRAALVGTSLWDGVGILACGHYFVMAEPPYGLFAMIASGIYFAVGVIPIGMAVYYAVLSGKVADAQLYIDRPSLAPGESITAAVQQVIVNDVQIDEAKVGLVCQITTRTQRGGKTSYSSSTAYEDWVTCLSDHRVRGGSKLEFSGQLSLPTGERPSSPPRYKGYPKRVWAVGVDLKLAGSPDYRASFPITVREGTATE